MEVSGFFRLLKKRLGMILLIVLLGCGLVAAYSIYYVTPVYSATAKLIINKSIKPEVNEVLDLNSINSSIMLVNTYKEIIMSSVVLEKVINKYPELLMNERELLENVKVRGIEGTQVITVSVTDKSHIRAAQIVNALSEVFKAEIPNIMKVDNVTILQATKENDRPTPIGPNIGFNMVVSFLAFSILSIGIALLIEGLDDTIKTEEELQEIGLPVLGVLKKMNSREMKRIDSRNYSAKRSGEAKYAGVNQ